MTRHFHPAHRRQAIQWARNLIARKFYVLDTETTGLGPTDEVVQIAILDGDGEAALNQLVRPTVSIPPVASAIHGIHDSDVLDAPSFKEIYIRLSALLAGQVVIAYNMDFDWRLLGQTAARYRLPPIRIGKRDCAMKQYARFKGIRQPNGRNYVWHKLGVAIAQEGLPAARAHDALGDARMTLSLIRKMASYA
ncbi:MAG: 3'-5' exonuclease [Chloroflexota bacterium]|nr:3'-5' exonuclease [Chloroflexota bacterium]MDE2947250.1 3'-5' exonuclease [Chloroflexota bacterium]